MPLIPAMSVRYVSCYFTGRSYEAGRTHEVLLVCRATTCRIAHACHKCSVLPGAHSRHDTRHNDTILTVSTISFVLITQRALSAQYVPRWNKLQMARVTCGRTLKPQSFSCRQGEQHTISSVLRRICLWVRVRGICHSCLLPTLSSGNALSQSCQEPHNNAAVGSKLQLTRKKQELWGN